MSKSKNKVELTDELGASIAETINKQFKSQNLKTAYFLEGDEDAPTIVKEWISTGSTILDLAISNDTHCYAHTQGLRCFVGSRAEL